MGLRTPGQSRRAVESGDILGTVQETVIVEQRIMVPCGISGVVESIESGAFTVEDGGLPDQEGRRTDG